MSFVPQIPTEVRAESRYQDLAAKFYFAQANFHKSQSECVRLRTVVLIKQEVIEELLPYYPHPLSSSLQAKIYLT